MQSKLKEVLETYINDYEKLEDEHNRIEIKSILLEELLKLFDINYQTMANRMIPDVCTEEKLAKQLKIGELTNKQLNELLLTKGRKGTR